MKSKKTNDTPNLKARPEEGVKAGDGCCSPADRGTCCVPSAKAACCGTPAAASPVCGCR